MEGVEECNGRLYFITGNYLMSLVSMWFAICRLILIIYFIFGERGRGVREEEKRGGGGEKKGGG